MSSRELISKRTRLEFREFLVCYTLREITDEFSVEGLYPARDYEPDVTGQRRGLVEQYYYNLDFSNCEDVRKLIRVFESILVNIKTSLDRQPPVVNRDHFERDFSKLVTCLRRDGLDFVEDRIVSANTDGAFTVLLTTADAMGSKHLASQIRRISESLDNDTDLAIGQAKELLETCCKLILDDSQEEYDDRMDLQPLVKKTMSVLALMPSDISQGVRGEKAIKSILGNLSAIAQGMAEVRNLYGTGHGKRAAHRSVPVRHARLAVGAATTLAQFLFDTYAERNA